MSRDQRAESPKTGLATRRGFLAGLAVLGGGAAAAYLAPGSAGRAAQDEIRPPTAATAPMPRPSGDWTRDPARFIAHAGGGYRGWTYTNAEEAVLAAIGKGFLLIELDLLRTADGYLVAAHDWTQFRRITGEPGAAAADPLTLAEFTRRKIHGTLTPLTEARIRDIFATHPDLLLVTDKIRDFAQLTRAFPFADRLVVEVFGAIEYARAQRAGIRHPALSIFDIDQQADFIEQNDVRLITVGSRELVRRPEHFARLVGAGRQVLVFTTNDHRFMAEHVGRTATAFYTDFWNVQNGRCETESCQTY